jgi:hypothetical protein
MLISFFFLPRSLRWLAVLQRLSPSAFSSLSYFSPCCPITWDGSVGCNGHCCFAYVICLPGCQDFMSSWQCWGQEFMTLCNYTRCQDINPFPPINKAKILDIIFLCQKARNTLLKTCYFFWSCWNSVSTKQTDKQSACLRLKWRMDGQRACD